MTLRDVTRSQVLDQIARFDELGQDAFLAESGFGPSKVFQLRFQGRSYPSKAILGAAAGLEPRDFFGGVAQTVPALRRLGFEIRQGRRVVGDVGLAALVDQIRPVELQSWAGRSLRDRWTTTEPSCYFASGSNRPGEIRGLAAVGHDVGVVAGELNEEALLELERLAGSDVQVFVDSGAFSEVEIDEELGMVKVVREMTEADWDKVLDVYFRLSAALGSQLWIVAPDRVGDQAKTLERLDEFKGALQELEARGVRILFPVQKGALASQASFYKVARLRTGLDLIPALPCKKAATTVEDAEAFFDALDRSPSEDPGIVHFLGLGPRNKKALDFVAASGDREVSLDSNWIRANVGRKAGLRAYTEARDLALGLVASSAAVAELAVRIALGA